jgi:hypothetical protein
VGLVSCAINISTKDDEQVATGLGYIVHVLLLTSKYLEVCILEHYVVFFFLIFYGLVYCCFLRGSMPIVILWYMFVIFLVCLCTCDVAHAVLFDHLLTTPPLL